MPSRRAVLAALGTAGAGSLAGCGGVGGDEAGSSGAWHSPGYDHGNTAFAPDVAGPEAPLTTRWEASVPRGNNTGSPVVADDRVYVGYADWDAGEVGVRVLDLADGSEIADVTVTKFDGGGTFVWFWDSVVVTDEAFYVLAYDGMYSFTLDGEQRWRLDVAGGPTNSILGLAHPAVVDGTAFVPTAGSTSDSGGKEALYAVDDVDGSVRWRWRPDVGGQQGWTFPPAYADGTVYCTALEHSVVALDVATGSVQWEAALSAQGPPTVTDDRVFVPVGPREGGESPGHVVALSRSTGEERWRATGPGERLGRRLTAADGRIYHRERLQDLVARDAATGDEVWRVSDLEFPSRRGPVVTEDALYVTANFGGSDDGSLVVLDPETGERRGVRSVGIEGGSTSAVALADGLAVTNIRGRVVAVESCGFELAGHCLF